MNKRNALCACFLICTLLFGCANGATIVNTNQAENSMFNAEDANFTTIESYSEYLEHIEEASLPDGFLMYESISHLGEFDFFVAYWNPETRAYSEYHYNLVDSSGTEWVFSVYHHNKFPMPEQTLASAPDLSDMRMLSSEEDGNYLFGNLWYFYIDGKLYNIQWKINDITCMLKLAEHASTKDYPVSEETIFGTLLNIQGKTPEEAMQIILNK